MESVQWHPGDFAVGFVCESSPPALQKPRLLDRVREEIRKRHYSRRTEKTYVAWIRRFILFHGKRHPAEMGEDEVSRYLSHLAVSGKVSASTQNQALSSLLFLYRHVLCMNIEWVEGVVRAKRPVRLPVVLTREEVRVVLRQLQGVEWIMASLLYGAGLRLLECCRLRVKDVDLEKREIVVRDGKGGKDRVTLVPAKVVEPLRAPIWRWCGRSTARILPRV
jgi:integrase